MPWLKIRDISVKINCVGELRTLSVCMKYHCRGNCRCWYTDLDMKLNCRRNLDILWEERTKRKGRKTHEHRGVNARGHRATWRNGCFKELWLALFYVLFYAHRFWVFLCSSQLTFSKCSVELKQSLDHLKVLSVA